MSGQVRIVTDSNSMIPWELANELGIVVVPLTIVIDGDELVEDRNLDVADVYRRLRRGGLATTSAPSPGAFAAAYDALAGSPIVSVHIGSNFSATLNAARLGSSLGHHDVRVVDSGLASFMAGCCVIAATQAALAGETVDGVVAATERIAAQTATVFTVAELDRARAGGRFERLDHESVGVPLFRLAAATFEQVGSVTTADEASTAMFDAVAHDHRRLRIGVGDADAGPVVDELVERLRAARPGDDIIRYVVGPTVAAHAGMGTFGIVYHPLAEP